MKTKLSVLLPKTFAGRRVEIDSVSLAMKQRRSRYPQLISATSGGFVYIKRKADPYLRWDKPCS